ncbi:dCTP deaminase, partial [Candidatus Poribacteria bacterium]
LGRMPVALYPGMRICAFTFELLSSPAKVPYNKKPSSKYLGQPEPLPSRFSLELEDD